MLLIATENSYLNAGSVAVKAEGTEGGHARSLYASSLRSASTMTLFVTGASKHCMSVLMQKLTSPSPTLIEECIVISEIYSVMLQKYWTSPYDALNHCWFAAIPVIQQHTL